MTHPDLLRAIGQALYGTRWQSEVARDLGVSEGMVRKYLRGESAVSAQAWATLAAQLRHREGLVRSALKAAQRASKAT